MKKIISILKLTAILLIFIGNFSCGKETKDKAEPNNHLLGAWQLIETIFGLPNGWSKVENIFWDNACLLLQPSYMACDEGCVYKFQKLNQ